MCLDVQADCLSLSVHFILCLLNFRWLSKTANKRTNWCQLQGFPQRNWNEPARSFHTRDSSSIPPFNEGWSATLMLFYIKTQSLICLNDIWSEIGSISFITGTEIVDFPELEFDVNILNITISVRIQHIDS